MHRYVTFHNSAYNQTLNTSFLHLIDGLFYCFCDNYAVYQKTCLVSYSLINDTFWLYNGLMKYFSYFIWIKYVFYKRTLGLKYRELSIGQCPRFCIPIS